MGAVRKYPKKQVVVCTPGRMIDLLRSKTCTMRQVTYLVFDEADRMFDMGFEPQVWMLLLLRFKGMVAQHSTAHRCVISLARRVRIDKPCSLAQPCRAK